MLVMTVAVVVAMGAMVAAVATRALCPHAASHAYQQSRFHFSSPGALLKKALGEEKWKRLLLSCGVLCSHVVPYALQPFKYIYDDVYMIYHNIRAYVSMYHIPCTYGRIAVNTAVYMHYIKAYSI